MPPEKASILSCSNSLTSGSELHVATSTGATNLNTMFGFVMNADGVTSYPLARTMHNGINPSGDIVGHYNDATGIHGFLLTKRGGE